MRYCTCQCSSHASYSIYTVPITQSKMSPSTSVCIIIAGASFETRSADVLRSLAWDDLETRRCATKSILLYKVLNDCTGPDLKESLIWRNTRQTNYDLRSSLTDLTFPKQKREFLKKSFNYSGAKLWNSLPLDAKVAESVYQFKNIIRGNDS